MLLLFHNKVLREIFHGTSTSDPVTEHEPLQTQEPEALPLENGGQTPCSEIPSAVPLNNSEPRQLKRTKDASFQVKPKKPKMNTKRYQINLRQELSPYKQHHQGGLLEHSMI